jgi:hypothetical protein
MLYVPRHLPNKLPCWCEVQQWSSGAGLLATEMVHGRARAPPRQTWRVAVNEGRLRVSLRSAAERPPSFIFHETAFSKRARDHVFVTPHPSESHPISLCLFAVVVKNSHWHRSSIFCSVIFLFPK